MKRKAGGTRDRILNAGLNMLSETGLSGVTLGLLSEEVGMSKSGLFAHFHSKDEVQIALLQQTADVASATVVGPAMAADEGLPRLKTLIENWLGWSAKAGLRGGCPVAAALFELDDLESPVRDKVAAMESEWRMLLMETTRQAVAKKELRADLDVEQFVWELCGIYLSHHASTRFLRSADAGQRAHIALEALFARALPDGSEQSGMEHDPPKE